jgi:hypothetical protein
MGSSHGKLYRLILSWIILIILLAMIGYRLNGLAKTGGLLSDFAEYWAAGRLNVSGGNPYDPERILELQKEIGWTEPEPVRMWNPPWSLTLVTPFAILPYSISAALWVIVQSLVILFSADLLWRFYSGKSSHRWVAWVFAFLFFPTISLLKAGQIGAFILLGVAGFLRFNKKKNWWVSGIFAALIAIKPHLIYLFWVALFFWAIDRRYWKFFLGLGTSILSATVLSWAINPGLIRQYLYAMGEPDFINWATPTLGTVLRILFGPDKIWLQFMPPLVGFIWFLGYWPTHRRNWDWAKEMPLLLLVSLVSTAFGWGFDQVVLLVAVIQVCVWMFYRGRNKDRAWTILSYLGINALAAFFPFKNEFWFVWMAPCFLIWYMILYKQYGQKQELAS